MIPAEPRRFRNIADAVCSDVSQQVLQPITDQSTPPVTMIEQLFAARRCELRSDRPKLWDHFVKPQGRRTAAAALKRGALLSG